MPYRVIGLSFSFLFSFFFFLICKINDHTIQNLLMFEILFTQDSEINHLFCGAPSNSEPSVFFSDYFLHSGLGLFKMTFCMTLLE